MFSVSGWLELSHVTWIFEALAKIAPKGAAAVSDRVTTPWKTRRRVPSGRAGFPGAHQSQGLIGQLAQQSRQLGDLLPVPVRQQ